MECMHPATPLQTRPFLAAVTALFLTLPPAALFAQAPAEAKPAPPGAAQVAANAAEMAKPLTPADKKFIKEASETLFFELAIVDITMRRNRPVAAGRDATFQVGAKLQPDLQKAWEDLAKFAKAKNEEMREDLSGVEKRDIEEIRSVNFERFHKVVVEALGKEGKKLAQLFAATTAIQHPALKKIAASHAPVFKQHVADIAQAAK
jgi:hypothetical protein